MQVALGKYFQQPKTKSLESDEWSVLELPIMIAACKTSQFNYGKAKQLGYKFSVDFFSGITTDADIISWSGLQNNSSFNETFAQIFDDHLDSITFDVENGTVYNKLLIPNGLCKVYEGQPKHTHEIYFDTPEESFLYTLFVTDRAASTSFQLNQFLITGENVYFETAKNSSSHSFSIYNIKLKILRDETGDGSCTDYPNTDYASYANCVDAEMERKIMPVLGCMVPWLSESNQCTGAIEKEEKHLDLIAWLKDINQDSWGGVQCNPSSCLPSCSVLSAEATFENSGSGIDADSISVYIEETVQIEKLVLAYDSTALLVEIGSSLGLWLGLSAVGLFDMLVYAHVKLWQLIQGMQRPLSTKVKRVDVESP